MRGFVVRAMPVGAETFVTAINWGVLSAEEAERKFERIQKLATHYEGR